MKFHVVAVTMLLGFSATALAKHEGKKVVFIDSYHEGYEWSDGLTAGVKEGLKDSKAELKIFRMDTKRNGDEAFKKAAGEKAKAFIEENKADIVIVGDDNATKYVLAQYYKDSKIPFVFAGVNWDASGYGLPYKNATGMLEVALYPQLIDALKPFARGTKIGYISSDNETERKDNKFAKEKFKFTFAEERFVKSMEEWKKEFVAIQDKVDILLFINNAGLKDWNNDEAKAFALANTKIPTGTSLDWMANYCALGYARSPEEQGLWASNTAKKILDGAAPSSIAIAENKEVKLYVNMPIAEKLKMTINPALLKTAKIIR